MPAHFEFAATLVTEETVAKSVVCGRDPRRHLDEIQKHVAAGYDHVCIHQIGPDQDAMLSFYEREILPQFLGKGLERKASWITGDVSARGCKTSIA